MMRQRKILMMVLVGAIVLAGCTSLTGGDNNGSDEEQVPNQGLIIEEVTLEDTTLRENGGTTRAIMRGSNTNPTEISEFSFAWSNTGILDTGGNPIQTSGGLDDSCSGTIEGASQGVAPTFECIWEIEASDELRTGSSRTIPLTSLISYQSTLETEDEPVRIEFVEDAQDRESSAQIDNRELRVSITYPSQLYTDMIEDETFEIDVTVQNIGGGSLIDRSVDLSFNGAIPDRFDIPDRCGDFTLRRDSNTATRTCAFNATSDISVTEGDYLGMDITADYGYELQAEHPVTVEAR